ncbi:hypothetical protein [Nonomuraea sp. NPDC050643]|uniref:hypothetical protein n=1 Tax=Nonomuraea sp. NPDC050643 TaxID=3155660 RepID=UPI00340F0834
MTWLKLCGRAGREHDIRCRFGNAKEILDMAGTRADLPGRSAGLGLLGIVPTLCLHAGGLVAAGLMMLLTWNDR